MGLRFSGAGFRVQGSGFRVQGLGFKVQGSGVRVQGSGFMVQGSGFRVQGSGLRGWGVGFGVWGVGFRSDRLRGVLEQDDRVGDRLLLFLEGRTRLGREGGDLGGGGRAPVGVPVTGPARAGPASGTLQHRPASRRGRLDQRVLKLELLRRRDVSSICATVHGAGDGPSLSEKGTSYKIPRTVT